MVLDIKSIHKSKQKMMRVALILIFCSFVQSLLQQRSLQNATTNTNTTDDDELLSVEMGSVLLENTNEFGFLIISDWGKGGESGSTQSLLAQHEFENDFRSEKSETKSTNQVAVAKAMAYYAGNATIKPEFVVSIGDNFYTKGH